MPSDRELLHLDDNDWDILKNEVRSNGPGKMLIKFWEIALGYSSEAFASMPKGSFHVDGYELAREDHDKLFDLLSLAVKGKRSASAVAMLWLDLGPACAETSTNA